MILLGSATDATKVVFDLPAPALAAAALLLGLSFLVSIGAGLATIYDKVRPKPSAKDSLSDYRQEASDTFATKHEVTIAVGGLRDEINKTRNERREELRDLRILVDQGFAEIRRALGRVEGKLEEIPRE